MLETVLKAGPPVRSPREWHMAESVEEGLVTSISRPSDLFALVATSLARVGLLTRAEKKLQYMMSCGVHCLRVPARVRMHHFRSY